MWRTMTDATGIDKIKREITRYLDAWDKPTEGLTADDHAEALVMARRIRRAIDEEFRLWDDTVRFHTYQMNAG